MAQTLGFPREDVHNQTRNCSAIYLDGNGLMPDLILMAVRVGGNFKSNIYLLELDLQYKPKGYEVVIPLGKLPQDALSQEDPRLLIYNGKILIVYSGYCHNGVSVCIAELRYIKNRLIVEQNYCPQLEEHRSWEKNWGLFTYENELYAIYTISPIHKVLKIVGDKAEVAYETETNINWPYGEMRGGAPPVRVGNRYYNWFHSSHTREGDIKLYHAGLYTFDAEPPFIPREIIREPVLTPTNKGRYPHAEYDVVFPGGAYLRNGKWSIWYGLQETWIEVIEFMEEEVSSLLEPIQCRQVF